MTDLTTRLVVALVWFGALLSVQPWSRPVVGMAEDGASPGKGVLLASCWLAVLLIVPFGMRLRIPAPVGAYLVYAAVAAVAALLLADPSAPLMRITRLFLALTLPVLIGYTLHKDPALFIRIHFWCLVGFVGIVLLGISLDPNNAWSTATEFVAGGRLQGAFIPMMPNRVGEIGALVAGLAVVMWAFRQIPAWAAVPLLVAASAMVLLSRSRTAAGGLVIGLILAGLVTMGRSGGRRILLSMTAVALVALPFLPGVVTWATRGQSGELLSSASGRTATWSWIGSQALELQTVFFGHGLGNKKVLLRTGEGTIGTAPIDNSWVSTFWETGALGAGLLLAAVVLSIVAAVRAPTPFVRAGAMFMISYVVVGSMLETGLSDVSSLTLTLLVAGVVATADRWAGGKRSVPDAVPVMRPRRPLGPFPTPVTNVNPRAGDPSGDA